MKPGKRADLAQATVGDHSSQWNQATQIAGQGQDMAGDYYRDVQDGRASVAQQQLRQGLGQAQRAMGAQAMARGSNPLAMRQALMQGSQMAQQANVQSAALRAQEMAAAQQQRLGMLQNEQSAYFQAGQMGLQQGVARNQAAQAARDAQNAQNNANRDFAMGVANQAIGAAGGAAMMSDERAKNVVGGDGWYRDQRHFRPHADLGRTVAALRGEPAPDEAMGARQTIGAALLGATGRDPQRYMQRPQDDGSRLASGYEMKRLTPSDEGSKMLAPGKEAKMARLLESGAAKSPEEALAIIAREDEEADETARKLTAHRYRYTPESGFDDGQEHAGIMAQDLEDTPNGRGAVVDTPRGKAIDVPQATGVALGLIGRQGDRLDELERAVSALRGQG